MKEVDTHEKYTLIQRRKVASIASVNRTDVRNGPVNMDNRRTAPSPRVTSSCSNGVIIGIVHRRPAVDHAGSMQSLISSPHGPRQAVTVAPAPQLRKPSL